MDATEEIKACKAAQNNAPGSWRAAVSVSRRVKTGKMQAKLENDGAVMYRIALSAA